MVVIKTLFALDRHRNEVFGLAFALRFKTARTMAGCCRVESADIGERRWVHCVRRASFAGRLRSALECLPERAVPVNFEHLARVMMSFGTASEDALH